MAREAILRDRLADPIDFTVADGTGIEKGAICKITDPRTAILSDGSSDVIAGIAAREKVASNGRTRLSIFRCGVFDLQASGAIAVGDSVVSASNILSNTVKTAIGEVSGAQIIGTALETATADEVIQVHVNIGAGGS